jgi:WD40 repeat protein
MFNAINGSCKESFRTVSGHNQMVNARTEEPPTLTDVLISSKNRSGILKPATPLVNSTYQSYPASINCMVGSIGAVTSSYLITGGGDGRIRYWDFTAPSKCFVVCGQSPTQPRPSFERVNFESRGHLMICRQLDSFGSSDTNHPRKIFHGLKKPDHNHTDSIQDIKIIDKHVLGGVSKDSSALISCSKDSTIKIWR